MGIFKDIVRMLGLSQDARVQISAPEIEVIITGHPEKVRLLLPIVKGELERGLRRKHDRRSRIDSDNAVRPTELDEMDSPYALPEAMVMPVNDEAQEAKSRNDTRKPEPNRRERVELTEQVRERIVPKRPRVVDESDETVDAGRIEPKLPFSRGRAAVEVSPVLDQSEQATSEVARSERRPNNLGADPNFKVETMATVVPEITQTVDDPLLYTASEEWSNLDQRPVVFDGEGTGPEVGTLADSDIGDENDEGPEVETTAIAPNPSGPQQLVEEVTYDEPRPRVDAGSDMVQEIISPFVTDGGPTIAPTGSDHGDAGRADVHEISDNEIQKL